MTVVEERNGEEAVSGNDPDRWRSLVERVCSFLDEYALRQSEDGAGEIASRCLRIRQSESL